MNQRYKLGTGRRLAAVLGLLVALSVVALGGAITSGQATPENPVTATLTVLNDVGANIPGQPTPGGNIGYELSGENTKGNTVNHVSLTETIGASGKVVYINSSGTPGLACSGLGTSTLTCSVSQLKKNGNFDVIVLFKTDSAATPGSNVSNTVVGSFDPQTPNKSNNRKTDTFGPSDPVVRQYSGLGDGSLVQSLTLQGDALTAGGPHTSSLSLPSGFLNGFNFVGVTLQNFGGAAGTPPAGCPSGCQPFKTATTIPKANLFTTTGPFFNGSAANAFTWSFTIPVPLSFWAHAAHGVFHTDDSDGNGQTLPLCATSGGNPVPPTTAPGLCVLPLHPVFLAPTVTFSGLGVDNGHTWGF